MARSEFGKCFKLDIKKEIMPYELYTEGNINRECVSITDAIDVITKSIKLKYHTKRQNKSKKLQIVLTNFLTTLNVGIVGRMTHLIL